MSIKITLLPPALLVSKLRVADVFSEKAADETIAGSKTFSNQKIVMSNLPTADPHVAGQLWVDSGHNMKVSAG